MGSEMRLGQLIAPFGPGSIYTDKNGVPTVICGLDHWYKNAGVDGIFKMSPEAVNASILVEPRLAELLGISQFRQPPSYVRDDNNPTLSKLTIPGHRFPRWYVNNASGELRRLNLETRRVPSNEGFWKPVRFMAVCSAGHLSDFPWKLWAGCTCSNETGLVLHDSGGVDLGSIKVQCKYCHNGKSLAGATLIDRTSEPPSTGLSKVGIVCTGERPWLGNDAIEGCNSSHPLAAVMINQSNIYFSKTVSSIFLPDLTSSDIVRQVQKVLMAIEPSELYVADMFFKLNKKQRGLSGLKDIIEPYFAEQPSEDDIFTAYENLGQGKLSFVAESPKTPDSGLLAFRRAEFNVLRNEVQDGVSSELRILPAGVSNALKPFIEKVMLVERLRETKVFYGFDRLERSTDPLKDMPESALNQLFIKPPKTYDRWLPAVKNYGEGIYFELSESAILDWIDTNCDWLKKRYDANFISRMSCEPLLLPPTSDVDWLWAARYQLVHTLSHLMINQLVFECGYSSASLKERLFISSDKQAPMAGVLIYTASGDSEGSMGGLVRLGRSELFEPVLRRALSRASWCSADPVCSEDMGGTGSRLVNKAACHACVLLPETACETINNGLDRAVVIGTPTDTGSVGFLSSLIGGFVS
jgi:hypothetical protein